MEHRFRRSSADLAGAAGRRVVFLNGGLRQVVFAIVAVLSTCIAEPTFSAESEKPAIRYVGPVRLGKPLVIQANFPAPVTSEWRIEAFAVDSLGDECTTPASVTKKESDGLLVAATVVPGRAESRVGLRAISPDEQQRMEAVHRLGPFAKNQRQSPVVGLLGVSAARFFQTSSDGEWLPDLGLEVGEVVAPHSVFDLGALAALIVPADLRVDASAATAIRQWTMRGGHLVLLGHPETAADFGTNSLTGWIPVKVAAEPSIVRDLGMLERLAIKPSKLTATGRVPVLNLTLTEGVPLAVSRDVALVARVPTGLGRVTLLALDPRVEPLANWSSLPGLMAGLVRDPGDSITHSTSKAGAPLTQTGVTDLATQLFSAIDQRPGRGGISIWGVLGLILAFVALVGPFDFALVHWLLRRPGLTWLTYPMAIVGATAACLVAAQNWRSGSFELRQLDLIDWDASTGVMRGSSWYDLGAQQTARYSVAVKPIIPAVRPQAAKSGSAAPSVTNLEPRADAKRLAPFAPPETTFGGMYSGGVSWSVGEYSAPRDAEIERLPMMIGATRALQFDWIGSSGSPMTSSLNSAGVGRLSGTITSQLAVPLEDWGIAFGNSYVRLMRSTHDEASLPLRPGESVRVDQANMFRRELKSLLTGSKYTKVKDKTGSSGVTSSQTSYNPLNADPLDFFRMLSFHRAAGGTSYTGLTNALLADLDLTAQLESGRAVIFGRLARAGTTLTVNDAPRESDSPATYVRIVLPVEITREIRSLPRLVPSTE